MDWVIACMVPLHKGKGDVYECSNFRGISLLRVVGKVYGRVLINRIRDKTENVIYRKNNLSLETPKKVCATCKTFFLKAVSMTIYRSNQQQCLK